MFDALFWWVAYCFMRWWLGYFVLFYCVVWLVGLHGFVGGLGVWVCLLLLIDCLLVLDLVVVFL